MAFGSSLPAGTSGRIRASVGFASPIVSASGEGWLSLVNGSPSEISHKLDKSARDHKKVRVFCSASTFVFENAAGVTPEHPRFGNVLPLELIREGTERRGRESEPPIDSPYTLARKPPSEAWHSLKSEGGGVTSGVLRLECAVQRAEKAASRNRKVRLAAPRGRKSIA